MVLFYLSTYRPPYRLTYLPPCLPALSVCLSVYNYLSIPTCLCLLVCTYCPYLPIYTYLSVPTCLYLPIYAYLFIPTYLYLPVCTCLSMPTCLGISVGPTCRATYLGLPVWACLSIPTYVYLSVSVYSDIRVSNLI